MPSTPQKSRGSGQPAGSSSTGKGVTFPASPSMPNLVSPSSRSPVPHNYHPYQIQTTASSLLTRSNSSPLQPVSEYKHRSSRSMSSMGSVGALSHSVSDGELAVTAAQDAKAIRGKGADKESRRRSIDGASPGPMLPKLRRSGTLPVFLKDEQVTPTKESIPDNPKHWSPAHLARYLAATLRNGDTGHTLPGPLIHDIEAWVLRQQVSGRAFLKGQSEAWATSARAPPFLPVLLNISRRLRRSSLQSRLGDTPASPMAQPDSPLGSILIEAEDEDAAEDDDDTGVRRMARMIERPASAASSASSVSIDDERRPRLNSGNSQAWKEWEARGAGWVGRRRKESGASSCADSAEHFVREQGRNVSGGSATSATSATSASSGFSADSEILETPLDVATLKAPPVGLGFAVPVETITINRIPSIRAQDALSLVDNPADSIVPTDEMLAELDAKPSSPHMANMLSHQASGSKPYASLRQTSGSRVPSLRSLRHAQAQLLSPGDKSETEGGQADDEMSRLATARRVTLRPTTTDIFGGGKSEREVEMEKQIAELAGKVKELEGQLVDVRAERDRQKDLKKEQAEQVEVDMTGKSQVDEAEQGDEHDGESKHISPRPRPSSPFDMLPDGVLARLGLIPEQDGLPTRMRELPAYLFFVGMGVGAVMVKVLFSRSR